MRFSTVRFDISHIFWLLKVLAEKESQLHGKDISRITYHCHIMQVLSVLKRFPSKFAKMKYLMSLIVWQALSLL